MNGERIERMKEGTLARIRGNNEIPSEMITNGLRRISEMLQNEDEKGNQNKIDIINQIHEAGKKIKRTIE
jgi:hypothetical protein